MLRFLFALLFLALSFTPAQGAYPTLTNFNREHFTVDPTASPTNVIKVAVINTNAGGLTIITNVTSIYVTNIFVGTNQMLLDPIWTNANDLTMLLPGKGATIALGTNVVPFWAPNSSDGLVIVHDSSAGEAGRVNLGMFAIDNLVPVNLGGLQLYVDSQAPSANFALYATTNNSSGVESLFRVNLEPGLNDTYMKLVNNGVTNFYIAPASGWGGSGGQFLADDGTYKSNSPTLNVTNLFSTTINVTSNLYVSQTNFTSNLYVTNVFEGNKAYISNIYVTNITVYGSQTYTIEALSCSATNELNVAEGSPNYKTITLCGNWTPHSTNRAAGAWFTAIITGAATNCTLTLPAWKFMNQASPTNLAAGKVASMTVFFTGTTEASGVCNYAVEP